MKVNTLKGISRSLLMGLSLAVVALIWSKATLAEAGVTSKGDEIYQPTVGQEGKDVIWVPSDTDLVRAMLEAAKVTSNDVVYDLGAGDGKIAIAAARDFGARAVGIEYNPDMAALAQRNVERAGLTDKVKIIRGDIFEEDFSSATVVTLYLLPYLNMKLRPTLLDMKPGTRIVSNSFDMEDWQPDEYISTEFRNGYFWIVPAKINGGWSVSGLSGANSAQLDLKQKFQMIEGVFKIDGAEQELIEPKLVGDNFSFAFLDAKGNKQTVELKVAGDRMAGQANLEGARQLLSATRLN